MKFKDKQMEKKIVRLDKDGKCYKRFNKTR